MTPRARTLLRSVLCCALCAFAAFLLSACDQTVRHKVLSTIFDGVPSLPPAEELCEDYYEERRLAEMREAEGGEGGEKVAAAELSNHAPYAEKRCQGCHDFDRRTGLKLPPNQLCLTCHQDFIKGSFVHGPVSVGDCLACHLPHTSKNPSLLVQEPGRICAKCHQEKRLTTGMHDRLTAHGIVCAECHDPHFGAPPYFLK